MVVIDDYTSWMNFWIRNTESDRFFWDSDESDIQNYLIESIWINWFKINLRFWLQLTTYFVSISSISSTTFGARSGFPPLRIFQAKHLQAQLELNAVHWLCREMHLDSWRKKVILPETLRCTGWESLSVWNMGCFQI